MKLISFFFMLAFIATPCFILGMENYNDQGSNNNNDWKKIWQKKWENQKNLNKDKKRKKSPKVIETIHKKKKNSTDAFYMQDEYFQTHKDTCISGLSCAGKTWGAKDLLVAGTRACTACCTYWLDKGADPNTKDHCGWTPLELAC